MKKIVFLSLALAVPAFAADPQPGPTVDRAATREFFKGAIQVCRVQGRDEARVQYLCPAKATVVTECAKTGEITSDQALSGCVATLARQLSKEEQELWLTDPLNPVAKK